MEVRVTADILENESGQLLLAFHVLDGDPKSPKLFMNDGRATLVRNNNQNVVIGAVHPDVREKLEKSSKILVSEVGPSGIVNGYFAPVGMMQ